MISKKRGFKILGERDNMKVSNFAIQQNGLLLKAKNKSSNPPAFTGQQTTSMTSLYDAGSSKFAQALQPNISFTARKIGGVMYSKRAEALGDAMISPKQALAMMEEAKNKVAEVKQLKETKEGYTNSRTGYVCGATVLGENGKSYTACNVDTFSSRWGYSAGMVAAAVALGDLNDSVKAIATTDMNLDRKSLQWLSNTSSRDQRTRGGRDLQVVTVRKTPTGKERVWVRTLADVPGFIPRAMPDEVKFEAPAKVDGKVYTPETPQINSITYSDKAQTIMERHEKSGLKVKNIITELGEQSQALANKIEKHVFETDGAYNPAHTSNYRFMAAVHADNGKIYTGSNSEFYDHGFLMDTVCSERIAMSKAVGDGANNIDMIFINNNQNHNDAPCAECLGWLSTSRAGDDLLIASFMRDGDGKKSDQVFVTTLSEMLPVAHKPSPKID